MLAVDEGKVASTEEEEEEIAVNKIPIKMDSVTLAEQNKIS